MDKKISRKYLDFELVEQKPKTLVYSIKSKDGDELARIEWHGAWRKYVFAIGGIIFDSKCLTDIVNFLDDIMRDRNEIRKKESIKKTS